LLHERLQGYAERLMEITCESPSLELCGL
jgi:hypothetical protein